MQPELLLLVLYNKMQGDSSIPTAPTQDNSLISPRRKLVRTSALARTYRDDSSVQASSIHLIHPRRAFIYLFLHAPARETTGSRSCENGAEEIKISKKMSRSFLFLL